MAHELSATEAKREVAQNAAMLVCAYADAEKCKELGAPGAQPLGEFQAQKSSMGEREVIFICA